MSTKLQQWTLGLALIILSLSLEIDSKVFERCELAKVLRQRHRLELSEIAQWVCIAQHSSGFNTAAQAYSPSGGSHGLFQISDVYWCSPPGQGTGCNLPCHKLRDDNLSDDLSCIKRIYNEHQRISGDGYTAWNAYQQFCKNNAFTYIQDCFPGENIGYSSYQKPNKAFNNYQTHYSSNAIQDYTPKKSGKVYGKCELARELYQKHKMPMQQIPTWVCIAEHESRFNTAAVGRLNADGSADHGLFQISDLYWCSHDRFSGGKACGLSCNKLLDDDITDDVRCIKRIHNEHTAISGDGFTAWTVYRPHCQNQRFDHIANCFKGTQTQTTAITVASNQVHYSPNKFAISHNNPFLKNVVQQQQATKTSSKTHYTPASYNGVYKTSSVNKGGVSHKGKVYTRCSLAQELYFKHKFPMQDIATWVCIAEHESQFNTAAIGRLNTDGSEDHGLFQISDRYWCEHSEYGGKACNLPCERLLDEDLSDDVECIKTIHEEHTRISGDGFNAWTVYKPHCQNQNINHIRTCFDDKTLQDLDKIQSATSYKVEEEELEKNKGKIYSKCELAKELYHKHHMPMEQIPKWVCIAQYESSFNTAAVGRLNTDGSLDHGLFQISDLYWCSHDRYGGKACNIPCHKLLDSDITDDVRCIKIIHEEHTRISGDGFNAWTVYKPHCRNTGMDHIKQCFTDKELKEVYSKTSTSNSNSLIPYGDSSSGGASKPVQKGKIYKKCELAQELYHKHHMPMEQIPKWVCIAQHESSYNTAAVGRLNTDGSLDHGLFQISDLYWCSHDQYGGKACNIPCDKLLDSDITDDVRCIKIIYEEHTRISGDGFNAWTVYKPHCRNIALNHVQECFTDKELKTVSTGSANALIPQTSFSSKPAPKGKIYKKCELAQELYHKHHMPMEQIPKWVCIAQHESSYNTAAVGRLNADGSADHGLFQISDLYWCSHDQYGGKACNIPCDKLLDSDISDDVRCIKIIYEEHTRISGDGFNAWTVYKPHCRNIALNHVQECFSDKELKTVKTDTSNSLIPQPSYNTKPVAKSKIYKKCELAQELYHKHHMPMEQIPKWVCIAQHESSYNTAAVGRLNADGSADHGLFQISDLYWCSHDQYGGKACNIPCDKLLDSDISDDVRCIKIIYEEHTRISGDGFNAWTVYKPHCRNIALNHVQECFSDKELKAVKTDSGNSLIPQPSYNTKPFAKGKIYKKCELAQELYHKHHMPMEQIPKWVCIAQHESSYNTAAVGRLNADGSADHGLFQISDLYWCSHDQYGGKACNIPCDKLLDSDISDDVRCIKIIYEEHTRISGDGFNAWTVYKPHCRNIALNHVQECFSEKELKQTHISTFSDSPNALQPQYSSTSNKIAKGKIYKKCELAQELLTKHKMPMEQIPTWVCIAQHESSFNTAAVGRLNADGSLDHGLFQISDLYWCSHDQYGGKACNIPCDKLLDSDISDDVRCIKIIYEEHTRISGDGFNAWTVYKPHCRNRKMEELHSCFTPNQIEDYEKSSKFTNTFNSQLQPKPSAVSYSHNPFLNGGFKTQSSQSNYNVGNTQDFTFSSSNVKPNYNHNPFLQNALGNKGQKETDKTNTHFVSAVISQNSNQDFETNSKPNYKDNPFLNGAFSSNQNKIIINQPAEQEPFKSNPFLSNIKLSASVKPTTSSITTSHIGITKNYLDSNEFRTTLTPTAAKPFTTNTFVQTTPSSKLEITKNYLNSNSFRTSTTPRPITTVAKPLTTTTRKPTTSWNNYSSIKSTTSWTTTKKPSTTTTRRSTTTSTTRKPVTTKSAKTSTTWSWQNQKSTTKVPKSTTTWNWQNQKYQNPSTTVAPRSSTTWNWQNQKYQNPSTTVAPRTTTTWNWQNQKYQNPSTTVAPRSSTTWNWQNQKYQNPSTTLAPRTTTTWNWQNQKYQSSTTTTTKKPQITSSTKATTSWNWQNQKSEKTTTKPTQKTTSWYGQSQKYQNSTTTVTPRTTSTTWNWQNQKYQSSTTTKTPKTSSSWYEQSTTTKSPKSASTSTTPRPITTVAKPLTTTTRKPTTSWNNYSSIKSTTSWTTTKKPSTTTTRRSTTTSTTRKPVTTKSAKTSTTWSWQNQKSTTKVPKSTTTWNWQNQKYQNPSTTVAPRSSTTWNWQNQKYQNPSTTVAPRTTTTWNWQNQKYQNPSTTVAPRSSTTWNWQNQKYQNPSTTLAPRTTTTWNWQNQKYQSSTTTTTKKPQITSSTKATTSWNWQNQKSEKTTTKPTQKTTSWYGQSQKYQNSTTTVTPRTTSTTWNWQNQKYQSSTTTKTPKTSSSWYEQSTTTKSPKSASTWNWQNQKYQNLTTTTRNWLSTTTTTTKSPKTTSSWLGQNQKYTQTTTVKPQTTTWNWRNTQKSSTNKPLSTTTANWKQWDRWDRSSTQIPTTSTPKTTYNWRTSTKKSSTLKTTTPRPYYSNNQQTTTLRPRTTSLSFSTTTTRRPITTKSNFNTNFQQYKNDPFSHPFFSKVNKQIQQLRDAPVILTLPHMLGASNEYTRTIRGLTPNAEKHQTFVDVQHLTGVPLQGGKRVQFNMFLKSINRITITENLTTTLMPAIWVEEGIELNAEMVTFFKKRLINTLKTLNVVQWAALFGGIGVSAICLIYYVVHRRKPAVVVEAPLK